MIRTFRFQITEAALARKPIVVLMGNILESDVRVGDRLTVPLKNGTTFIGSVQGILHQLQDTQMYRYANMEDSLETIGIGVWRSDCHESKDIFYGLVTNIQA